MLAFEILFVAYLLVLAAAAPWTSATLRMRAQAAVAAISVAFLVVIGTPVLTPPVRLWLPLLYIGIGYWLPALLTPVIDSRATRHDDAAAPGPGRFERWLVRTEHSMRGIAVPPGLLHLAELAYLACYPLVPVTFLYVWFAGSTRDVERFWTAVLAAGLSCYITLPWLVSRPPRLIEPSPEPPPVRRLNLLILGRLSHQMNTFPSGHVAVAVAAAVVGSGVSYIAGVILWAVAAGIAAGAVAGRYHFTVDVLLGVLVGLAAATAT